MHKLNDEETAYISLSGQDLTLSELFAVSLKKYKVEVVWDSAEVRVKQARTVLEEALSKSETVYGVNTGFGSRADQYFSSEDSKSLQRYLIRFLQCGTGEELDQSTVRLAITILINNLLKGRSGVSRQVIDRYVYFLNADIVPAVRQLGSIGASGDLVPMAKIASVICGVDAGSMAYYKGNKYTVSALYDMLGFTPLDLAPKEGLSLVNNTCMHTAVAVEVVNKWKKLLGLSWAAHLLMMEALEANLQPFSEFVQALKPHKGQQFVAQCFNKMAKGSAFLKAIDPNKDKGLFQDRYSIRCIPQFLGPQIDGLREVYQSVLVEVNAVTDNPVVDADNNRIIQSGNFLGQYIAQGMDRIRHEIGLVSKHMDVQIGMLMTKEFSKGLPASLSGNSNDPLEMGLKGLQIAANSIMPLIQFYGNSISERFPTHAEEFNQNINSQAMNAAQLAMKSLELFESYLAVSMIFACQAAGIRMEQQGKQHSSLSITGRSLFNAIHEVCSIKDIVLVRDSFGTSLESLIDQLTSSLRESDQLYIPINDIIKDIDQFIDTE